MGLRFKREARRIHNVVHHAHGGRHKVVELFNIQTSVFLKRVLNQTRHVDRAEQTCAIWRQRLFTTGVRRCDGFAVGQVIHLIDAVDKDHAGFSVIVGRLHDGVPQITRVDGLVDLTVVDQFPRFIRLNRFHERIGDENRHVEHAQTCRVGFRGDELFDIRVVTTHRRHHSTTARTRGHDGAAHRIPNIHERQRTRRISRHTFDQRAFGTNRREVVADAATLLHGQRRFFEHVENAAHRIRYGAHHKAVEQSDRACSARTSGDAASRQVFEIFQSAVELIFPFFGVFFDSRQSTRNPTPRIFNSAIQRFAVGILETVLHIPDLFGNWGGETSHSVNPLSAFICGWTA